MINFKSKEDANYCYYTKLGNREDILSDVETHENLCGRQRFS